MPKKVKFKSYYSPLNTKVKKGDIIQNEYQTILYIPCYKKLLTGKRDQRHREERWHRISDWDQWDFDLNNKERKRVIDFLGIKK